MAADADGLQRSLKRGQTPEGAIDKVWGLPDPREAQGVADRFQLRAPPRFAFCIPVAAGTSLLGLAHDAQAFLIKRGCGRGIGNRARVAAIAERPAEKDLILPLLGEAAK